MQRRTVNARGFTLIELVVVLVILGVLWSVGSSRFFSTPSFEARGFADESRSALRYAQKLSSAGGCHLRVQLDGVGLRLSRWATCQPASHTSAVSLIDHPAGGGSYASPPPGGVSIGSLDIYFDASGRPYDTASESALSTTVQLAIGSHSISLAAETGYAWLP